MNDRTTQRAEPRDETATRGDDTAPGRNEPDPGRNEAESGRDVPGSDDSGANLRVATEFHRDRPVEDNAPTMVLRVHRYAFGGLRAGLEREAPGEPNGTPFPPEFLTNDLDAKLVEAALPDQRREQADALFGIAYDRLDTRGSRSIRLMIPSRFQLWAVHVIGEVIHVIAASKDSAAAIAAARKLHQTLCVADAYPLDRHRKSGTDETEERQR